MKLVGRVPVEPLDDERMTNIERRVVAGASDAATEPRGLRAPRRLLGFAAAAMAAMAAGVIGWKLGQRPAQLPVIADAPISISTATTGGTLAIGDATIQSDPNTVFVVTRPDGGVLVDLTRGKVELEVAKRANRPPLIVRAGDTDVIVVGTHFSVDYGDGTGEVAVRVTEGVVRVVRHHQEARVAIGQAWETQRGVIALADAKPVVKPTAVAVANTPGTDGTEGGTIGEVDTGSGSAEIEMGPGPDVLHGRTAQVPDQRTPTARNTGSGAEPVTPVTRVTPEITTRTKLPDAAAPSGPRQSVTAQPVAQPLDVGEQIAAKAIGKYQELIRNKTTGEEESRAYYGIAFTQHFKLGRTADAKLTIAAYERRFAQGRVYPERIAIAWLKVRIACKDAIGEECRQAAASYVRLDPDSPAGHVAQGITLGE